MGHAKNEMIEEDDRREADRLEAEALREEQEMRERLADSDPAICPKLPPMIGVELRTNTVSWAMAGVTAIEIEWLRCYPEGVDVPEPGFFRVWLPLPDDENDDLVDPHDIPNGDPNFAWLRKYAESCFEQ